MSNEVKTLGEVLTSEFSQNNYLRQSELIPTVVPFSPATLWRKVKKGEFPAPVKLSKRITAWRREDVVNWLNNFHKEST